jgi:hypothetical protein
MTMASRLPALTVRWRFAALLLAGLVLSFTSLHAKDRWLTATTGHFRILTNSNEREARTLVAQLEQFREVFLLAVPGQPFNEPKTTVVIFKSDKDFTPYKPLYQGKPKESLAGVFKGGRDEVVIAMSTERELERTIPTIYHEYVHLLMSARGFRLPPWLNEGLAELYETMVLNPTEVRIGQHNPIHVMTLNRSKLIPLARLFAITHSSPEYNEGNRQNLFYAQSWALVHYCMMATGKNAKPGDGFGNLVSLLSAGVAPEEAMQTAYGVSLDEMQEALEMHVRGGRYVLRTMNVAKVDYAARVKFEPATDFDREVELANLKWRLQRNGDATYQMMQLAEREPQAPRPHEVLAAIAGADRDRKAQLDYWIKAAELQSTNAFVYGSLAEDSMKQYMIRINSDYRLKPETSVELRGWLDRAIALDPDYAEAWDWLALTEAFSVKVREPVVRQLEDIRKKFGPRPRLLAGFAVIALRGKQPDFAEHFADELLKMPEVVTRPERNLAKSAAAQMTGGRGLSWTESPKHYPEVAALAKSVKSKIQKLRQADAKTSDADGSPDVTETGPTEKK